MSYFIEAYKRAFDFSGRSRRKEYWMFVLFYAIALIILTILDRVLFGDSEIAVLSLIFTLVSAIPSISITVRRLHDIGKSGWWILLSLIPFVGGIILFVFTVLDSQHGSNKWGTNPKENMFAI